MRNPGQNGPSRNGVPALRNSAEQPARLTVRPFAPEDHPAVRRLILEGLGEHFGFIDERINRDLEDIAAYYAGQLFLVAVAGGEVIGTGALVHEADRVARVVRMSVAPRHRRKGIGRVILTRLLDHARSSGYRRVLLETNDDWDDVIAFYKSCGFKETGRGSGEVHFALDLQPASMYGSD